MTEAHRSDAHEAGSGADRDAKIEQLLLAGLDHYFAAQYEQAINVWTRALFLDRSHPRARAYIERARSALAERQRESEELLQNGVAAFNRGESDEARRLLHAAIAGGAPIDEALAVLERLSRLETAAPSAAVPRAPRAAPAAHGSPADGAPFARWNVVLAVAAAAVLAGAGYAAYANHVDWRLLLPIGDQPAVSAPGPGERAAPDLSLPLPRRGEIALARAQVLVAGGHLQDALFTLDEVRPTDPQREEADRLRADLQRQLLALTALPAAGPPDREHADRRVP
jgi:tetratricopeptide (TPR) repeat protein